MSQQGSNQRAILLSSGVFLIRFIFIPRSGSLHTSLLSSGFVVPSSTPSNRLGLGVDLPSRDQQEPHELQQSILRDRPKGSALAPFWLIDVNSHVCQEQGRHLQGDIQAGHKERGGAVYVWSVDVAPVVSQEQCHVQLAFLACEKEGSGPSCVLCIHLNLWVPQQDFHNMKVSKATGTVKRSVALFRSNPIYIYGWLA